VTLLTLDPMVDSLRSDPRITVFLYTLKLPEQQGQAVQYLLDWDYPKADGRGRPQWVERVSSPTIFNPGTAGGHFETSDRAKW
jgi:hypothetical protein